MIVSISLVGMRIVSVARIAARIPMTAIEIRKLLTVAAAFCFLSFFKRIFAWGEIWC